jgi:hypothetical protein
LGKIREELLGTLHLFDSRMMYDEEKKVNDRDEGSGRVMGDGGGGHVRSKSRHLTKVHVMIQDETVSKSQPPPLAKISGPSSSFLPL